MNIVWKYKESITELTVKHSFINSLHNTSHCGLDDYGFSNRWKSDEKGLDKRRECKKCVATLARIKEYL